MDTVWVLGDQLRRGIASLHKRRPSDTRVLVVESNRLDRSKPWHVQRAHFVKASMRRFARQLEAAGFSVDYRRSASFREGLEEHRRRYHPRSVFAMEPSTWAGRAALARLDVSLVRSNQFLCHYEDFAVWAEDRPRIRMEAFYRWQRKRPGVLMDGTRPAGGRWSFDAENREPPPKQGADWPRVVQSRLDALDDRVLSELPNHLTGDPPRGVWATSRRGALRRLDHFVEKVLPHFGPHQDAMVEGQWHLNHSLLSPYLNVGLLSPAEVVVRAERAWREGTAPLASVEGFVRQIIGWREYMWGSYWLHMPGYVLENALSAERPLPPLFHTGKTAMRCVAAAIESVRKNAYAHHIQRLMILGNSTRTAEG
jgi:deoxyribodipyrimidine photolyase-related protein